MAQAAEVAHRHGARIFVDAAQLAPHVPIDMSAWDVDYLALSGHKLYAPYGAGVLVGRPDWLAESDPFLRGGGAVDFVTLDRVAWTELPDRQEAGTPNTIGAVALGVACEVLDGVGMGQLEREEQELYAYARRRLAAIEGLTLYSLWGPRSPAAGHPYFQPGRHAPLPRCGRAVGGARHRRPSRLLLRPPTDHELLRARRGRYLGQAR